MSIKCLTGIVLIAFFKVMSENLKSESFLLNILINMPMWITVFIFFKWRNWVVD